MSETPPPADGGEVPAAPGLARAIPAEGSGTATVTAPVHPDRGFMIDPFGLRTLIISWCLWLLVSWSITLYINATMHAVRWVVFSAAFGLMAVWPALRLSQQLPWYPPYGKRTGSLDDQAGRPGAFKARSPTRVLATLLDWLCLAVVFQVVIWPLMLVGQWSVRQTLWLDIAVLSWSLLTGALVGLGRVLPTAWARMGAMGLCMLILVGEPAWMALSGPGFGGVHRAQAWQMRISPLQALWELTTTVQPYSPSVWVPVVLSVATAAVLAWLVLGMMAYMYRQA